MHLSGKALWAVALLLLAYLGLEKTRQSLAISPEVDISMRGYYTADAKGAS